MNDVQKRLYQRRANQIARRFGYQKATSIVLGGEDKIIERVSPGYRKKTTGEYVCNAYIKKFGWKNTYYQAAVTVVMLKRGYKL